MAKEIPQGGAPKDIPLTAGPRGESLTAPVTGGITGLPTRSSETFPDPTWNYIRTAEPVILPLQDDGDDPGEDKRTQTFSPRTRKAGAAISAAAALSTMMSPLHRPSELGPIFEPPYVYGQDYSHTPDLYDLSTADAAGVTNGVVETPRGNLPIVNLAVHVDPEDFVPKPGEAFRVSTVESEARDDDEDGEIDRFVWQAGDSAFFVDDNDRTPYFGQPFNTLIEEGNINGIGRNTTNKPADLRVSGANDGIVVIETIDTQTDAIIQTEVYQEQIVPTTICADGTEVVMAVAAPQYVDGLCAIEDMYDDYTDRPVRVVVNQAEATYDRESHFDPPDNIIRFSLPEETDTRGYDTSNDVKVHEFAHAVYEQLDEASKERIEGTHIILENNMRYRTPTFEESQDYYIEKNEPVWGIYTESTYYGLLGRDDEGGHPFDAPTELFASVTNIVRTFPDLLQDQFATLRPNEQHAAGIALVEVADAYLSQNPDPEALRRLMPELGSTLAVMSKNPVNDHYQDRMIQLHHLLG